MNITRFFINRPTLFWSLMAGIIIAGVLAFIQMPKLEDPHCATNPAMIFTHRPCVIPPDKDLNIHKPN